jgi:putative oxidoreductase
MNEGLLLVRIVFGLLMAAHGAQKWFGWFGGHGLTATAGFFEALGFRPARLFATTAAATEIASGLLMALGLLGPVGPALMVSVMIVAAISVHWKNGLFAANGGIEVALLYGAVAASLTLIPPGRYSLDAAFGLTSLWTPAIGWLALGVGIVGGVGSLLLRRPTPAVVGAPA